MLFKDFTKKILFSAMVAIFLGGAEPLCNFGRGHFGKHSCEINVNLDQCLKRRCHSKKKFMHG